MHIGLVGREDPQSIQSYSGTPYFMSHALMRQGCEISFFLHLREERAALVHARDKLTRLLTGKHINHERDPVNARHYPEQINEVEGGNHSHDDVNNDVNGSRPTETLAQLPEVLKNAGFKTFVVDEAHHLRAEWWKTLTFVVEKHK